MLQITLRAQRCMGGGGGDDTDTRCWGIMDQKGVWVAEWLTFLYTELDSGNQGQLWRPVGCKSPNPVVVVGAKHNYATLVRWLCG